MYARRTPKAVFRRKLNVKTLVDYKNDSKNMLFVNMVPVPVFNLTHLIISDK